MRSLPHVVSVCIAVACAAACATFASSTSPGQRDDGGPETSIDRDAAADAAADPACPDAVCGEVIATGQENASEIAVDDTGVVWTISDSAGSVREIDVVDGGVVTLGQTETFPRDLTLFEGFAYFLTNGTSRFADRQRQVASGAVSTGFATSFVLVAKNTAFFTSTSGLSSCTLNANACTLNVLGYDTPDDSRALAFDPVTQTVWLVGGDHIYSFTLGAKDVVLHWHVARAKSLAVDETNVYVLTETSSLLRIARSAPPETEPSVLADDLPPVWAFAIDGTQVFLAAIDEGFVMKVSKDGLTKTVLASDLPRPKAVAQHGAHLYVILSDGRIVSIPKG